MTLSHGVALTSFQQAKAQEGSDIEIPNDKTMIAAPFAFSTRHAQIITLIHEMAHFLGDAAGSPDCIGDPPGRKFSRIRDLKRKSPAGAGQRGSEARGALRVGGRLISGLQASTWERLRCSLITGGPSKFDLEFGPMTTRWPSTYALPLPSGRGKTGTFSGTTWPA
jgi:hypothetical protein